MKKLLALLATLAVAVSLSMPVFAHQAQVTQDAPHAAPAHKHSKKKKHAKKHKTSKKVKKSKKKSK